jgi:hypothetical protein
VTNPIRQGNITVGSEAVGVPTPQVTRDYGSVEFEGIMNTRRLYLTLMATSCLCLPGRADEPQPGKPIPEPRLDRIDYNRPQDFLDLHESLGNPEHIRTLAASLRADSPERTLLAIGRWMNSNLTCDNRAAYALEGLR